nr:MAG TPA: hypothetical protein [Caudoviricetes sp.]
MRYSSSSLPNLAHWPGVINNGHPFKRTLGGFNSRLGPDGDGEGPIEWVTTGISP